MDIEVRGRTTGNASKLRSKIRIEAGSVTIRIDDDLNDPAWIEVELTSEQVCDIVSELSVLYLEERIALESEQGYVPVPDGPELPDIVDIVGEYIPLFAHGHSGSCPFHEDEDQSLRLSSQSGRFFCRSCEAIGDVADFVALYEKVDRDKAIERLMDRQ